MRRSTRIILASGAAAISFLALSPQAAHAVAPTAKASFSRLALTSTLPNSNIRDKKGGTVFKPDSLNAVWSGPVQGKCTGSKHEITITNTTSKTQKVTDQGALLGTLPAGTKGGVCFWGTGSEKFTFGLDSSAAQLTVSVS